MSALLACVWIAGVLHLVVASANVFAFGKFRYLEHLQKVPLVLRQVFLVQNAYVMLVQVGLARVFLVFGRELISGRAMSRAIGGFLALFWGTRVLLQLFYYDRELRRANRVFDVLFILADGYLAITFVLVALTTESPE